MQDPQKTPLCVPTQTIALLAMGCDDEAQDMIHISQCERCSALLRDALEDLTRDATAEELQLAESIPPPQRPVQKSKPRWPLAIAAALFVLVAAGAYRLVTPPVPSESLTAQLSSVYATHRTLDLRLAGTAYAEPRLERAGTERSPYAKIALAIEEGLEKDPKQPSLLRDKGRLALLEGRYDEAISILESVVDKVKDPEAATDLAAAYFQRGLQRDSWEDRKMAFTRYQAFVREHPADPVAAFNLALVGASTQPTEDAAALFQKYLTLETSPQWKQEAQERLARLLERK